MAIASLFGVVALPIVLIGILLPVALVIALQVWLCKRKNRWLGLILPGLTLLFSLVMVFSVAAFGRIGGGSSLTVTADGQVVEERVTENGMTTVYDGEGNILDQYPDPYAQEDQNESSRETVLLAGVLFLVNNIPTIVLGGIWLHYRNRRDFHDELKKMNIQDLE